MKIAFVITRSDTVGGAHVHVLDLALACRDEGCDVVVLAGGEGPYTALLRERGLNVVSLKHLRRPIRPHVDALAFLELVRILRTLRPTIVHAHSTKAGLLARAAARLLGTPVVFTAHGWAFSEAVAPASRWLATVLERLAARWSDAIICVSEYDRRLAISARIGRPDRLVRIHNGVHDVQAKARAAGQAPAVQAAHAAKPAREAPAAQAPVHETLRIVSVARLDVPKDHALLLDALATIRDIDWQLELIGDGPLTESVRQKARRLGLQDRVRFSGLCNDVADRLAHADLFVLVSDREGFPLSILEAMSASLPVVASDVGGVSEAVVDGVTGFLVPRGDLQRLSERLRTLLVDASLRHRFGREGRLRFEQEFSFELMYRRTRRLHADVLRRQRLAPAEQAPERRPG